MALSTLTGQVAAQSLHGGLGRGVVNLCQLFNHGHHHHTPCRREDRVSMSRGKPCRTVLGRKGEMCAFQPFQNRELLFAIHL